MLVLDRIGSVFLILIGFYFHSKLCRFRDLWRLLTCITFQITVGAGRHLVIGQTFVEPSARLLINITYLGADMAQADASVKERKSLQEMKQWRRHNVQLTFWRGSWEFRRNSASILVFCNQNISACVSCSERFRSQMIGRTGCDDACSVKIEYSNIECLRKTTCGNNS